ETEGTTKSKVRVACNCTGEEISNITLWLNGIDRKGVKINSRRIDFEVLYTNLDTINPSDVLLILGNKSLSPYYNTFKEYIKNENGIVLMADPTIQQVQSDIVYKEIFGLKNASTQQVEPSDYDEFRRKPNNATDVIYTSWKYFYHIPIPLSASPSEEIPTENLPPPSCSQVSNGSLRIQVCNVSEEMEPCSSLFWICDSRVYFDNDWNGTADTVVQEGESFNILNINNRSENFTFVLSYIEQERIGVSFRQDYKFDDFIKWNVTYLKQPKGKPPAWAPAWGLRAQLKNYTVFAPEDGNLDRILIQAANKTINNEPVPGVILNVTPTTRVAWIANFTEEGVGDDERLLLISLLLWASNKRAVEIPQALRTVHLIPYINVYNRDMFEVYRFNLGLGYPY
ncbi:MAG: hypothetical protein QMD12_01705, partial [Candidatus Aenigmarchaeota archaeon]|nr:hypothetical protein [Candidatus Aenigmarchaeota archaeon]